MVKQWKVLVLGPKSVGKTTLVNTFLAGKGPDEFKSDDSEILTRDVIFDKEKYIVEVMDCPECCKCFPDIKQEVINARCLVVLYSITSRQSFHEAENFVNDLYKLRGEKPYPLIIVGNKTDLDAQRVVLDEEGFFLAQKLQAAWMEISSLKEEDVKKVFLQAVTDIDTMEIIEKTAEPTLEKAKKKKRCCCVL